MKWAIQKIKMSFYPALSYKILDILIQTLSSSLKKSTNRQFGEILNEGAKRGGIVRVKRSINQNKKQIKPLAATT